MTNQHPILHLFLLYVLLNAARTSCKSTIEPCSDTNSCNALLGYTLYTDLKVSEVASLFQIDPIDLLTANAFDISYSDVDHHILPSKLFLKVPITCFCADGIRRSVSTHYRTRLSDTLSSIADSVYGGLVSPDQLREANSIADPSLLDVGHNLVVPLPCTCFNGSDNSLPSIYLSYVVKPMDTLAAIAARYFTTLTDLMNVNDMGSAVISDGDILAVPIPACASNFPKHATDFGLLVPNGSYTITASHCVQCSCGPQNLDLYCIPSSLAVSCSSMQCKRSNLTLGNVTVQHMSSGCNVTSCNYDGFVHGNILTMMASSLQSHCPDQQRFPPLRAPPSSVARESVVAYAPSVSPSQPPLPSQSPSSASEGTGLTAPKSSVMPATRSFPVFSPANGHVGRISSAAPSLVNHIPILLPSFMLLLITLM
ncbi:lysM domain-containing GPI-anchored protein 1-like [Vigna unguiculata]|uniref:Chitin elicitor-binding protein n=1 Tax=Vigna unguiculata TaxID=3917 RepID=A0A4D6MGC6_VIGUN|nr:lysM domain-containing GPI-anchored protein 1-like [Vigna unguiculata]QCD99551.1 chitin elicitor-binding protein [Vigna unguiculata]